MREDTGQDLIQVVGRTSDSQKVGSRSVQGVQGSLGGGRQIANGYKYRTVGRVGVFPEPWGQPDRTDREQTKQKYRQFEQSNLSVDRASTTGDATRVFVISGEGVRGRGRVSNTPVYTQRDAHEYVCAHQQSCDSHLCNYTLCATIWLEKSQKKLPIWLVNPPRRKLFMLLIVSMHTVEVDHIHIDTCM